MDMLQLNKQLKKAVSDQNVEQVALLLEKGALSSLRVNADAGNLLHHTTVPEIATLLILGGADVNARNRYRMTPLLLAIKRNNYFLVRTLLKHNASIHCRDMNSTYTPLHIAILNDNVDILKILLDFGCDVNSYANSDLSSPLHIALKKKSVNTTIVHILLEKGADLNKTNLEGDYPIHIALKNQFCPVAIIQKLIDYGADIALKTHEGNPSLHCAIYSNCIEKVKFLLELKANTFSCNINRRNSLNFALRSNANLEIIKLLLKHSSKNDDFHRKYVNAEDSTGKTPLHIVLSHINTVNVDVVEELLKHGADMHFSRHAAQYGSPYDILFHYIQRSDTFEEHFIQDVALTPQNSLEYIFKLFIKYKFLNPAYRSCNPLCRNMPVLPTFIKQCRIESVSIEKALNIPSLFEFVHSVSRKAPLSSLVINTILDIFSNDTYPIYKDVIVSVLNRCDILNKLCEQKLYTKMRHKIYLDWDSISNLANYLSMTDLFNLTLAFYKC